MGLRDGMTTRILIGAPTLDTILTDWAASLIAMMDDLRSEGHVIALQFYKSFTIHNAHIAICRQAQDWRADYVLLLDADMTFPPDTARRLLAEDKPVIGCTYVKRQAPHAIMCQELDLRPINCTNDRVRPVLALPTGCMLIRMDVFDRLRQPWFAYPFDHETLAFGTDDIWFCDRVREAGFDVWLHPSLSRELGHWATRPLYITETSHLVATKQKDVADGAEADKAA